MTIDINLVPAFAPFYEEAFNRKIRYFFTFGGRGGAKSLQIGDLFLTLGAANNEKYLCTREVQKSIEDSVYSLLKERIETHGNEEYGFSNIYKILKTSIKSNTGTEFIFSGLSSVTEQSIKSKHGINRCWVEEAQAVSQESLRILLPTIREDNSKIYFSYNRTGPMDPVHFLFNSYKMKRDKMRYTDPDGNKYYWYLHRCGEAIGIEINWDGNPFFPVVLDHERKRDQASLSDAEYNHIWGGLPRPQQKDAILSLSSVLAAMEKKPDDVGHWSIGVDVARNGKDGVVVVVKRGLSVKKIIEYKNENPEDIMRIHETGTRVLKALPFEDSTIPIYVDDTGLGGGLTDWLIERDYMAIGVNFQQKANDQDRYTNAISEMWFNMQNIIDNLSLPYDNILLEELTNRSEDTRDTRGRRRVESKDKFKEKFGRSPDRADAVLLACYSQAARTGERMVAIEQNIF